MNHRDQLVNFRSSKKQPQSPPLVVAAAFVCLVCSCVVFGLKLLAGGGRGKKGLARGESIPEIYLFG